MTRTTVITDIRISSDGTYLEVLEGVVDLNFVTPPAWAQKIPLEACGGY
jgi:hypothetical protein